MALTSQGLLTKIQKDRPAELTSKKLEQGETFEMRKADILLVAYKGKKGREHVRQVHIFSETDCQDSVVVSKSGKEKKEKLNLMKTTIYLWME